MSKQTISKRDAFIYALKHYGLFEPAETYKVICPFHGDLNPSMQISLDKQFFYCYGCGIHGSTFELIKGFEPELSTLQILRKISEIDKLTPKIASHAKVQVLSSKNFTYREAVQQAKDYYLNLPKTNWYRTIEEAYEIKRYMQKRGFLVRSLVNSGAKATYSNNYPIVFPILDNGIFRGYVQRTNLPEIEGSRKYLYNVGFKRRKTLAGSYNQETPLLIVEGFLDCLAANQLGIENCVAILGWKISSEQIQKIKKKGISTIICALDNDDAGRKGYEYLKKVSATNDFDLYRIRYPKGIKDFGDLLKNKKAAEKVLNQVKKIQRAYLRD